MRERIERQVHSDDFLHQILRKDVLQIDAEPEECHGNRRKQIHSQQPPQERKHLLFDIHPSHGLVLDGDIEDRHDQSGNEQTPPEE